MSKWSGLDEEVKRLAKDSILISPLSFRSFDPANALDEIIPVGWRISELRSRVVMEGDRPTADLPLEAPAAEVAAASGGGGRRFCGRGGGALAAAGADLLMVNFEMIVNQKWLGIIDKINNLRSYMNTFSLLVLIQMQMLKLLRMPLQKEKAGSQRWQNLRS